MRKILVLLAGLAATACAAPPQEIVWEKEGATEQSFNEDRYKCVHDALTAGGMMYTGFGYSERTADPAVYVFCMISKGYKAKRR